MSAARRIRARRRRFLATRHRELAGHPGLEATDLDMLERAIMLARLAAAAGEVPVGAVVYRDGEVIAEAANDREATADPTGHAELVAIREAGRRLRGWRLAECSLAVTLEPCPMCAGAIVNARVGRVIYGATDPKAGACETLYRITSDPRLNHRPEIHGGVLQRRCGALLSEFFRRRRAERKAGAAVSSPA